MADTPPAPTRIPAPSIDTTFTTLQTTNLASSLLNTRILSVSNDYFASATNLLTPTPPIHKPGLFIHTGAWYDGWESRRHNPAEYDWVVLKLGVAAGIVHGVEIDTAFFVGNYGESVVVEGCYVDPSTTEKERDEEVASEAWAGWETILPQQPCGPSQRQAWLLNKPSRPLTHVRVRMYPDGGFARLRLYGHVVPPPPPPPPAVGTAATQAPVEELSSALLGGLALAASDQHYTPASNILLPGRGKDMGDGWETARSRAKGHVDWVVVKLGVAGGVERVVVDTKDFRGNFPRAVRVHGFLKKGEGEGEPKVGDEGWVEVVRGEKACQADFEHVFEGADLVAENVGEGKVFSHVMLTLVPDGGVKRFRVFGRRG
ncbi:Allantoicase [Onygenales sp. PD_40]|nr:Allantoicase [Onygenales sp. PD_40]